MIQTEVQQVLTERHCIIYKLLKIHNLEINSPCKPHIVLKLLPLLLDI